MPNDNKVEALQKAIEQEQLEDIRKAQRFRELSAKVRAFRDGGGEPPTQAELGEWAELTAKAAAVAERLDKMPLPRASRPMPPPPAPDTTGFGDSAGLALHDMPDSIRSPEVEWIETCGYALLELHTDAGREGGDIRQMMGKAASLLADHGSRDPIEVAQEVFKKSLPPR